jgi:hypothetical protein
MYNILLVPGNYVWLNALANTKTKTQFKRRNKL